MGLSEMTSLLVNKTISEYFPNGTSKCILPIDLLRMCIEYNVEIKNDWFGNCQLEYEHPYVDGKEHVYIKVGMKMAN